MYSLISKWTILPEHELIAIRALQNLALQVQQSEPNTWIYLVHTPDFTQPNLPTPPAGEVVFFEVYKDEASFQAHVRGPIFAAFVQQYGSLFLNNLGKPYVTLELLDRQAGFIRSDVG